MMNWLYDVCRYYEQLYIKPSCKSMLFVKCMTKLVDYYEAKTHCYFRNKKQPTQQDIQGLGQWHNALKSVCLTLIPHVVTYNIINF